MDVDENITRWLELVYILSNHRAILRTASGKINSMQRKNEYLKEELARAPEAYDQICFVQEESCSLAERLKRNLFQLTQTDDDSLALLEACREKLEKARAEYEEYNQRRQTFVEKARMAEEDIRKTQEVLDELRSLLPVAKAEQPEPEQPDWEFVEALAWEEDMQPIEEILEESDALTLEEATTAEDDFC